MSKTRRKRVARRREAERKLQVRRQATEVRELTTRAVTLRASSLDEDARTVDTVLATENPVPVLDMRSFEVIDEVLLMRGGAFPRQLPLLDSHISTGGLRHQLGSIRNIQIEKTGEEQQRTGTLHFGDGAETDHAWNLVRGGHVTDVSIGYRVLDYVDIAPGEKRRVRGRSFDNTDGARRLRVSTRWEAREGSVVPIGADQAAKIREQSGVPADPKPPLEIDTMNERLRAYLVGLGLRADASDEEALRFMNGLDGDERAQAQVYAAESDEPRERIETPADPPPDAGDADDGGGTSDAGDGNGGDADAGRRSGEDAEFARQSAIRSMAPDGISADLIDRAINERMTTEQAATLFLGAIRENRTRSVGSQPPAGIVRESGAQSAAVLGCAMMMRGGMDPTQGICFRQGPRGGQWMHDAVQGTHITEQQRREHERIVAQAERYADLSLVDIAREACRLDGIAVYGRTDAIQMSLSVRSGPMSIASMSTILSAVVNKALLDAYAEDMDTTEPWTRAVDVPDFKLNTRARKSKLGTLDVLPAGGTADHVTYDDVGETYRAHRYANQFVADEQTIINDDLAAIMETPREMGMAAARLRPDLVYAILNLNAALQQDGIALFDAATHLNLASGGPLDKDTLQALITLMTTQTQNDVNLNIVPTHLITPQQLRFDARELLRSTRLITGADTTRGDLNALSAENIDPISDNRISAAGVVDPLTGDQTTGSDTNFYLASSQNPEIEVGYVRGTGRVPTIRSFTLDRGQFGMGWDVHLDVGAKALGYRGVAKHTGAP